MEQTSLPYPYGMAQDISKVVLDRRIESMPIRMTSENHFSCNKTLSLYDIGSLPI